MTRLAHASVTDERSLPPNWLSGRRPLALAKYWSRLATSFSSSFPKHSSSVIGQYDLGAVGSFLLGFLSITTRACRQRVGWYPWLRQALRSEVSPWGKDSKTCLTIGQVIPDGPGADVGDTEAKACLTSSSVRGEWSKVWVAVH